MTPGSAAKQCRRFVATFVPHGLHDTTRDRVLGGLFGTLDRYVVREVAVPIVVSLAVVTLVLIVVRLLKLVDLIVNQGVPLISVAALLAHLFPTLLSLSLPMAVLLGTLLGIGRLCQDNEMVAARACGVSIGRMALPVVVLVAALYPLEMLLSLKVVPSANASLRAEIMQIARTGITAGLPEKVFNSGFDGIVIYFDRAEPPGNRIDDVMILDNRDPSAATWIFARSALLIPNSAELSVMVHLEHGWIYAEERGKDSRRIARFDTYDIKAAPKQDLAQAAPAPPELGMGALAAVIARARAAGTPDIAAEVERARRWTVPLAIFPFAMLGVILGLSPVRGGRSERFAMALALFFCYYVLMRGGEALAGARILSSNTGAAIPDLVFAFAAVTPFFTRGLDLDDRREGPATRLRGRIAAAFSRAGAAYL
jgi:lipopolysaccharide export system permease protein